MLGDGLSHLEEEEEEEMEMEAQVPAFQEPAWLVNSSLLPLAPAQPQWVARCFDGFPIAPGALALAC